MAEDMSDDERGELAERVRSRRVEVFTTKLAAYQAAGVNSATWDNVEKGASVKPASLSRVVAALWPESAGDWRRIDESPRSTRTVEQRLDAIERRLTRLERIGLSDPTSNVVPMRPPVTEDDLRGMKGVADRSEREPPMEDSGEPAD